MGSSSSADRSIARNSSLETDRISSLWLQLESDPAGICSNDNGPFGSFVHTDSFEGDILLRLKKANTINILQVAHKNSCHINNYLTNLL